LKPLFASVLTKATKRSRLANGRRTSALRDDVRRELLRAAGERRTVTYGLLMRRFRISRGAPGGKGIAGVIGEIDRHEARNGAPGFAAIVVRKDTGFPGGGFFTWEGLPSGLRRPKREGSNPRLSDAERRYVRNLQEEIWSYYKTN
jgi:hypothetical protein